jgi:osmotically-inducible protein OsmY
MRLSISKAIKTGGALCVAIAVGGCAETIIGAGAVTGVAVVQERSVGAAVDDTVIQADISRRLFEKSEQLFIKVDLEVVEGRVLLTGVVPSPEDAVEAVRIAWTVKGVREVLNEIQVSDKTSLTNYAKDVWVTARLRGTLLADREVSDINYNVETVNGVVYLMGIARDKAELDRVVNHARNIPGVVKVKSHVRLRDDSRRKG